MLVDLEIRTPESEQILRAVDHIYITRQLKFKFTDDVSKVTKTLNKVDLYLTEAGAYFITLIGELYDPEAEQVTDLDGLEPYKKNAKRVVYVGGSTFELITLGGENAVD